MAKAVNIDPNYLSARFRQITGMTFLDSEIHELLGEPLDGLLFTCVGVPEYASAAGGPPGAPTEVRTVTPRMS